MAGAAINAAILKMPECGVRVLIQPGSASLAAGMAITKRLASGSAQRVLQAVSPVKITQPHVPAATPRDFVKVTKLRHLLSGSYKSTFAFKPGACQNMIFVFCFI